MPIRNYRWPLAILPALAFAAPAYAQSAGTNGSTTIVEEFSLTKNSDLVFGSVLPPTSGSNIVVIDEAAGTRSLTGGGNGALVGGGTSRATYLVEGDGGRTFAVTLPSSFTITRSGGSETIVVTLVPSAADGTLSGTSGTAGSAPLGVGGSFPVTSSTIVGAYLGNFTVSVDNN